MGIGNIGITQLIIVLVIVMLVFGTKKIRNLGGDLGSAIRDFRKGMNEVDAAKADIEAVGKDSQDKPAS